MTVTKWGRPVFLEAMESNILWETRKILEKHYAPGSRVYFYSEPGDTLLDAHIKGLIASGDWPELGVHSRFEFFWAATTHLFEKEIHPALENGVDIICCRFDLSKWAYQIHGDEGHELRDLFLLKRQVYLSEIPPALYLYLDETPEMAREAEMLEAEEAAKRGKKSIVPSVEYLERVRYGYTHPPPGINPVTVTIGSSRIAAAQEAAKLVIKHLA